MPYLSEVDVEIFRKGWEMSLEGLTDAQIEYGINEIAKAKTPHQKFPPNPQEFREICQAFRNTHPHQPVLQLEYSKTCSSVEKENQANNDRYWFSKLTDSRKLGVWEDAVKANYSLAETFKHSSLSVLDFGFENSPWFIPVIDCFKSYNRLR